MGKADGGIWIILLIILILAFVYASNKGIVKIPDLSTSSAPSISIQDLSLNPSNYIGKNVTITGTLSVLRGYRAGLPYTLGDSAGYYVYLDSNSCVWGVQRSYYDDGSHSYTAIGTFENGNYILCSTHLE